MSLSDDETSAGHWVQKRGVFMLAERKDEKLHLVAEMGRQKNSIRTLHYIYMVSFRGWLNCRVAECFVFSLPLRKWVNKSDIDRTSQSRIDMTRRLIDKKSHWKPKHLAKGNVSDTQSWHINSIEDRLLHLEMAFIHFTRHLFIIVSPLTVSGLAFFPRLFLCLKK